MFTLHIHFNHFREEYCTRVHYRVDKKWLIETILPLENREYIFSPPPDHSHLCEFDSSNHLWDDLSNETWNVHEASTKKVKDELI